jgi:hypothetical protein
MDIIRRKLAITATVLTMAFAVTNIFAQATIKSVSDGEKVKVLGIINSSTAGLVRNDNARRQ